MVQLREELRLALEARETLVLLGEGFRKDLDSDLPTELEIPCAVNLPHTAGTNGLDDLVMPKSCTRFDGHDGPSLVCRALQMCGSAADTLFL